MNSSTISITCESIEIRMATPHAAPELLKLASSEDLTRYLAWRPHSAIDSSLEWINDTRKLWNRRTAFLPGIFDRESQRLMGSIGLSSISIHDRGAELGTWIGVPYQRKGINLLAKAAMFHFAFDVLQLERVQMLIRVDNEASRRSAAKLPQLTMEGVLRSRLWTPTGPVDAECWALTRSEWDPSLWPTARAHGTGAAGSLLPFE